MTSVPDRILVLGPPGAGKSTFATTLGARIGYPVIHLDEHFWKPGWAMPDRDEWIATQRDLAASSPTWIMDGNYDGTLEIRLPAADAVAFVDVSRWRSIRRIIGRWLRHRGEVRPSMAVGCPEKIDVEFVRYAWTFETEERPIIERKIDRYGDDLQVVSVDGTVADPVDRFLDAVAER